MDERSRRLQHKRRWSSVARPQKRKSCRNTCEMSDNEDVHVHTHCHIDVQTAKDNVRIQEMEATTCTCIPDDRKANSQSDDLDCWHSIDEHTCNTSSASESENEESRPTLHHDLIKWVKDFQVKHDAVDDLLAILRDHGHPELPLSARTLPKTPKSRMQYFNVGLINEMNVKMDTILENQKIQMAILTSLTCKVNGPSGDNLDDIIPKPLESEEELQNLCKKLEDPEKVQLRKIVVHHLSTLAGNDINESVRRMLKWLGTNLLWSGYSYKGRKGKKSFSDLVLAHILIKACQKSHTKLKTLDIEDSIKCHLKYCPNKKGGARYKSRQGQAQPIQAPHDTSSDEEMYSQ